MKIHRVNLALWALLPLFSNNSLAATATLATGGDQLVLSDIEARFVQERIEAQLQDCEIVASSGTAASNFRLTIDYAEDGVLEVLLHDTDIRANNYSIYQTDDGDTVSYGNCSSSQMLPVLALMLENQLPQQSDSSHPMVELANSINLQLSEDSLSLSSHEPNRVMARMDANDINRLYMDFNLSLKHPVLNKALDPFFDWTGLNTNSRKGQVFFAFNGRFSQYIGSRESSPVVSRRFNPELFLRIWNDENGYWDVGYGHESNGQQINNSAAFQVEASNYEAENQDRVFARDGISRGWDYLSLDWQKQWNTDLLPILDGDSITHFEFRRYLSNGVLQGKPEEYNRWEDAGSKDRPRDNYDGLNLSLQYLFSARQCSIANLVCLDKLELTQTTGYSSAFEHNTTTLELTTDIFGLPFQLWAKSGYNSDLVDYYDYTNSWGFGLEFISD